MSNIIGLPPRGEPEKQLPPMNFYEVFTKDKPDGSIHYGFLMTYPTFTCITDSDSMLILSIPHDNLLRVERRSMDVADGARAN